MTERPRAVFPVVQVLDLIGIAAILLAMTVYLAVSLGLSLAMNAYNAAILRRGGRAT